MCRDVILQSIHTAAVTSLPLPNPLKAYLLFHWIRMDFKYTLLVSPNLFRKRKTTTMNFSFNLDILLTIRWIISYLYYKHDGIYQKPKLWTIVWMLTINCIVAFKFKYHVSPHTQLLLVFLTVRCIFFAFFSVVKYFGLANRLAMTIELCRISLSVRFKFISECILHELCNIIVVQNMFHF